MTPLLLSLVLMRHPGGVHYVALHWTASTTIGVRYRVYKSQHTGGPYYRAAGGILATSYSDYAVMQHHSYFYVVRAVKDGVESVDSNEAEATVK